MNSGYEGFEASWHDLFWEAEKAPSELPLMEKFLEARKGKCLYIGSGSGRLLGPLVAAGYDVLGLECSSEMARFSRENFPEAKVVYRLRRPINSPKIEACVSPRLLRRR